jgi:cytochrome c
LFTRRGEARAGLIANEKRSSELLLKEAHACANRRLCDMQTVGGFDEAPGGDDFYKSSGEFDVHVFIALSMLINVNEIRLFALLFDERVLVVTRIREPDAQVYAQAALTNLCLRHQCRNAATVWSRFLPRKKKLSPISTLVLTLMSVAVGSARGQDAIPPGRPGAGAIVFKKCMACHQIGPNAQNGIAPVLNGVVNRPAGQYPNYSYSSANKTSGLVWDEGTSFGYLRAPAKVVPGTKMIFPGLKNDQEISDVIAYLKQFAADGKQNSP